MPFRAWRRRVLVLVPLGAAMLVACGSDDQPGGGGPLPDSGAGDTTIGDGAIGDALGDASRDGGADSTADVAIRDVTTEVVLEDTGAGDAPVKDSEDEFVLPDGGCGPKTGYSNSGDGGASTCGIGQTYSCQGAQYVIDCNCPSSTCTCTRNGTMVGPTLLYGGCNSCSAPDFAFLAIDCNVPY